MSKRPKLMRRNFESESIRITPVYVPKQLEKSAPCQLGCANCGDIRKWIGTVAQRGKTGLSREQAFTKAWQIIVDVNPFPAALGRICPHPCEKNCNRAELDEALAINALERFLGDWAIRENLPLVKLDPQASADRVGVIGAGPSGLSFAYQMARRGYRVTVYEGRALAGGMLHYGVPDYRLPAGILQAEIDRILGLGVELKLNTRVGLDITLDELREEHSFLYLAIGAQKARHLNIPGEEGPSVLTGTNYLEQVNCGQSVSLGENVIVIGGGNTAIDAARCARREGAEVTIAYRRSSKEMPAVEHEVEAAIEEGVRFKFLCAPLRIQRNPDKTVTGVVFQRMQPGKVDDSGRPQSIPVSASEFNLAADSVICAVSQSPSLKGLNDLDHKGDWLLSDETGLLEDTIMAGGDALGPGIAGNAIVQGRRAAEKLHERFSANHGAFGNDHSCGKPSAPAEPKHIGGKHQVRSLSVVTPSLPSDVRITMGMAEVTQTITEAQFLKEVERCFSCGSCFGCEQCFMYCTSSCFSRVDNAGPGVYFTLTLDQCEKCGKCVEVCPSGFLEVE